MSTRLSRGGALIDRSRKISFTFNGKRLTGHPGDTLASALLANDQVLVGRSFKYHRPRGLVASGAEEPNALVGLGVNGRFEPNQRATLAELHDGLEARSQNHWPSLDYDIGSANQALSRFFPAGFYYKTFIHPRPFWKHVFEPVIRRAAGLGDAPKDRDADSYEYTYAFCDLLVVGAGVAGLQAALEAGRAGKRVLLLEQQGHIGGRSGTDHGAAARAWIETARAEIEASDTITLMTRTMMAGLYDHNYAIGYERLTDHLEDKTAGPRHRLWRIRAGHVCVATGALERPLSFVGNDTPGVMLASAMRDYAVNFGVSPGDRTVIVTNNDDAYRTALALHEAGLGVPVIVDARAQAEGALPEAARAAGLDVRTGTGIAAVKGGKRVTGVALCAQAGEGAVTEEIACDAVAMSGGWSPVVHVWSHTGGKLTWDEAGAFFRPDPLRPPTGADGFAAVSITGAANGDLRLGEIVEELREDQPDEAPLEPVWLMPQGAGIEKRSKMFLDFQNDVKVADVQLAAREGFESVEHTKRYTTLGMATDQGKLSNINGLAVLADALGAPIPEVGTTTFRPPYTPISMGAIAGEARGELFQPIRRSPIQDWHEANDADVEPVGHWRRPYCFPRAGEDREAAVKREILATRGSVGLLDASTLGKIIVKGPDAARLMDMLYTGLLSSLKVGRCRYGLMCSENGFLI
ncbi:MAG: 2Fe-2S iron-sulfur cluster-binding protein, partial [Pseudomonadota bacterium]